MNDILILGHFELQIFEGHHSLFSLPHAFPRNNQEIPKEFTLCYTDGSKIKNRAGFALTIGSFFAHLHRNSASVFTAEL